MDELRVVARFAVETAQDVLPVFEGDRQDDRRPRAAVEAAWAFAEGAARTRLQRVTALDAHRAARDATTDSARTAARAAGGAASATYLHPLATPTLIDVLGRYPSPPESRNRVGRLMTTLDTALRLR